MDRRKLMKALGIGAAAVVLAPRVLLGAVPKTVRMRIHKGRAVGPTLPYPQSWVPGDRPKTEPVLFVGGPWHGRILYAHGDVYTAAPSGCECGVILSREQYTRHGPYAVADVPGFDANRLVRRGEIGNAHSAAHAADAAEYKAWCDYWSGALTCILFSHYAEQRGGTA